MRRIYTPFGDLKDINPNHLIDFSPSIFFEVRIHHKTPAHAKEVHVKKKSRPRRNFGINKKE